MGKLIEIMFLRRTSRHYLATVGTTFVEIGRVVDAELRSK